MENERKEIRRGQADSPEFHRGSDQNATEAQNPSSQACTGPGLWRHKFSANEKPNIVTDQSEQSSQRGLNSPKELEIRESSLLRMTRNFSWTNHSTRFAISWSDSSKQ